MYIRKVAHTDKNGKKYHTFKLIESVRTERGPRQRMLLNLGTDFTVPEEKWKDLANRIEEIVTGPEQGLPLRGRHRGARHQVRPGGRRLSRGRKEGTIRSRLRAGRGGHDRLRACPFGGTGARGL